MEDERNHKNPEPADAGTGNTGVEGIAGLSAGLGEDAEVAPGIAGSGPQVVTVVSPRLPRPSFESRASDIFDSNLID